MKRFYKQVAVIVKDDRSYSITLDGRSMRTPGRHPLALPTEALANCVAEEWREQPEEIAPENMPMTRFVNTAIDRVRPRLQDVIDEIAAYTATDLLCYRTTAPEGLAARQAAAWQPLLEWVETRYGAVLRVTQSIMPVPQDGAALAIIRSEIAAHDEFALSGMHSLTVASGSIVIALSVAEGRLEAAEAAVVSLIDETYQAEKWGEDSEVAARRELIIKEITAAARFLEAVLGNRTDQTLKRA